MMALSFGLFHINSFPFLLQTGRKQPSVLGINKLVVINAVQHGMKEFSGQEFCHA